MMLIIIFSVMIIGGIVWQKIDKHDEVNSVLLIVTGSILLLLTIFVGGMVRLGTSAEIAGWYEQQRTIDAARKNGDKYEKAAIVVKMIEQNNALAGNKHLNKSIWLDIFIPDEIENLKPLK